MIDTALGLTFRNSRYTAIDAEFYIGTTNPYNTDENSEGASRSWKRILAHEFGHYLEMSLKNRENTTEDMGGLHDNGPFPTGTVGLMRSGKLGGLGHWMRHEDWKHANETAKEKMK